MKYESLQHRLIANSVITPDGCWVWLCKTDSCGYGRINLRIDGKVCARPAHRVSFEAFIGVIPVDHDIDHQCKNRACINPEHLKAKYYITHRSETGISSKNKPKRKAK